MGSFALSLFLFLSFSFSLPLSQPLAFSRFLLSEYSRLSFSPVDDALSDDYEKEEEEEEQERESGGKENDENYQERASGGRGEKTEIERDKEEEEGVSEEMVEVPWQTLALASTSKEKKGKEIG